MAQRDVDDGLAERLGGISLESVGSGEGKSTIGPAGLIHKVRRFRRYTHTNFFVVPSHSTYCTVLCLQLLYICNPGWHLVVSLSHILTLAGLFSVSRAFCQRT